MNRGGLTFPHKQANKMEFYNRESSTVWKLLGKVRPEH